MMKHPLWFVIGYTLFVIIVTLSAVSIAKSGPLDETRCCIEPVLNKDGTNKRRADVLVAFKKFHPCPATGLSTGSCPNWQLDHVIPLECGGEDSVSNLQWLPLPIKTAAGKYPKDRFERKIYCQPMELVQ